MRALLVVAAVLSLASCKDEKSVEKVYAPEEPQPCEVHKGYGMPAGQDSNVRNWLGKWVGPENTFLNIETGKHYCGDRYVLTIQNLDGPRVFEGKSGYGSLQFDRDGITETIKPGSGTDTGMKWLADKKDCLVVKSGEGYCRD